MSGSRRRTALVLLLVAAMTILASPPAAAREGGRKKDDPAPGKEKPRLRLVTEPSFGFSPVNVVLTGQLSGVDPKNANFCHAAVTWIRIDPGQTEDGGLRVRENPACLHAKEEVYVPMSFTRSYALYTPGSYLFRLQVEGKDGTRIDSGYAKVEVLRIQ